MDYHGKPYNAIDKSEDFGYNIKKCVMQNSASRKG